MFGGQNLEVYEMGTSQISHWTQSPIKYIKECFSSIQGISKIWKWVRIV